MKIETTDRELHQRFIELGRQRFRLTNELLAILPEINEKKIFKKYADSIEEYCWKYAGLTTKSVQKRLWLEKKLEGKPRLKTTLKDHGMYKVMIVVTLATSETDEFWADKVINMSKAALRELAKEFRIKFETSSHNVPSLFDNSTPEKVAPGRHFEPENYSISENSKSELFEELPLEELAMPDTTRCHAAEETMTIKISGEILFMFRRLKQQLGQHEFNENILKLIFEKYLKELEAEQAKGKELHKAPSGKRINNSTKNNEESDAGKTLEKANKKRTKNKITAAQSKPDPRYIKAAKKREIIARSNHKCEYPNCNKLAEHFHHAVPYSISHSHDSIKHLCKSHHEMMHNGIITNQEQEARNWQFKITENRLTKVDELYKKHRKEALL